MKKLFMTIMLAAGLYGLVSGQVTQSQSGGSSSKQGDQDKKDGWEKIGEKTVNLSEESGIFTWDTDREKTINANEKYSAIKFKTKDATVNLTNIEVEYEDGKKQNLDLIGPVIANSESKVVPLESKDKKLDKITFNYKKDVAAVEDKVQVELWGLKADASGMGQRSKDLNRDVMEDVDRELSDTSMILDRRTTKPKSRTDIDRTDVEPGRDRSTTPVVPR